MSDQASETPLLELLRKVPLDARGEYKHSPTHHSFIPYGNYAHRAADTIESLQQEKDAKDLRILNQTTRIKELMLENEGLQTMLGQLNDVGATTITPEMRAVLKRAFALAREVEESELAEDLCGILIETDPYRNPHLNTGGMGDE